eukprot:4014140-Amphidinium_carterae.1
MVMWSTHATVFPPSETTTPSSWVFLLPDSQHFSQLVVALVIQKHRFGVAETSFTTHKFKNWPETLENANLHQRVLKWIKLTKFRSIGLLCAQPVVVM